MSELPDITEPRLWRKNGWIAKVIKNEDDDGWAVEMTRVGDPEPSLVGPWTMGRDKKNPKPLDQTAFHTLVKTAREVIERSENAARARLHKSISYLNDDERRVRVDLDIVPDEDDPHAFLASFDDRTGEPLERVRVAASFKLTAVNAERALRGRGD
ncbi:MAG: hypothetical protein K1X94_18130 [Sandaracinaceae bacterium]|nr:hypothetical protein [Sandaracinaceae bacterium]